MRPIASDRVHAAGSGAHDDEPLGDRDAIRIVAVDAETPQLAARRPIEADDPMNEIDPEIDDVTGSDGWPDNAAEARGPALRAVREIDGRDDPIGAP